MAASVAMGYTAMIARGLRWSNLLEPLGYYPKKWNNIHAVALSYAASLLVPRSGEIVRCTAISQVENIPVDKLFGTVILERVIDSAILLVFLGTGILLNYDVFNTLFELTSASDGSAEGTPLWSYLFGAFLLVILVLFIFRNTIKKSSLFAKVKSFIAGMKEGFLSISKMKKKWEFIFYSIAIWAMYYFSMYVMFFALNLDMLGWNECLFLVVAGGLGVVIPTPGGVGSYHFLIAKAVLALGLTYSFWPEKMDDTAQIEQIGASLAALQWGAQTLMMIVVGLIATLAFALQRKKINAQPKG